MEFFHQSPGNAAALSIFGRGETRPDSSVAAPFDAYASDYSAALAAGLSVSGEDQAFFARGRIALLAEEVNRLGHSVEKVLDFGCGQGASTLFLQTALKATEALGVDVSSSLLDIARRRSGQSGVQYRTVTEYDPDGSMDCAYCNGVFHHVLPPERAAAASYVFRSLKPGGIFGLWENNPWNPGTRLVMRRISFDRDAIMLSSREARRMLEAAGFRIVGARSAFFFPRALRALRLLEPALSHTQLGAQYLVIGIKP